MNISDAGTHEVALYCFDWNDTGTRRQTIEVLNGSGQVLDTQALTTNFYGGVYLVWRVNGHVQFRVTNNAGPTMNAVVSGIFLATPPAAQTVNVMGGSPQTTTVGTAFGAGLQAQVLDGSSHPMSGVTVTFAAPGSGASALFGGLATATVVTDASGIAASPAPVANAVAGAYTVTATVAGVADAGELQSDQYGGGERGGERRDAANDIGEHSVRGGAAGVGEGRVEQSGERSDGDVHGAGERGERQFGGSATVAVVTDASGIAATAVPVANGVAGAYTVTATVAGVALPASFSLTNTAGAAASVAASGGTPQGTAVNTAFGAGLQALVKDGLNNPVSGVTVTFTAPGSGASAKFGGLATATAVTDASGIATVAPMANGVAGAYTVTATVAGVATPASFSLTNTVAPASIAPGVGTPQSAVVNTVFGAGLQAVVKDALNNPVSGVTVTFTAPGSGASAKFGGSATAAVVTNGSGIAATATPVAGAVAGAYTVTATVAGVATPASFSLTNTAGAAASISVSVGTPQSAVVNTAFGAGLQAVVKDALNNPVSGVTVTFTAPGSGANAKFGGLATAAVVTNGSGIAATAVPVANAVAGAYTVTATVAGVALPASFSLTNTAGAAASITASGGTPQSATVNGTLGSLAGDGKGWAEQSGEWGDGDVHGAGERGERGSPDRRRRRR